MGQFTEQIQQITAAQNEILSERKRKHLEKERKEFLKYLFDKYKLKIIETIEPISNYPYNDILYDDNIINIFANYNKDLKKYNIDDITIKLKLNELEKFTYKEISQQKSRYKKIELEEAQTQKQQIEQFEKEIFLLFEKMYKKYGYIAYNKLNNCKYNILYYCFKNNYSYKNISFYERLNKQFSRQYPQKQKTNYLSAVLLGTMYGLYKGFKNTNKRR